MNSSNFVKSQIVKKGKIGLDWKANETDCIVGL